MKLMNNNKVFYKGDNNIVHKLTFGLPGSGYLQL